MFFALILLSSCHLLDGVFAAQTVTEEISVSRTVPLTIKVVFIGPYFDPEIIDVNMLEKMLPEEKISRILINNSVTGVIYKFRYEFVFASQSFRTRLIKFLKSIEEEFEGENPWFYTFEYEGNWFIAKPSRTLSFLYDARRVEEWLTENLNELGGLPENGYMIIIADLRDGLPSAAYRDIRNFLIARTLGLIPPKVEAHYYKINYTDLDRGYKLRYREFAIGWGGSKRFWFLDLSAGPTFVSMWYDLPIQVIMEDQSINPYTSSGSQWLIELLADYIYEFVYNLAAPDFVYNPPWSENYIIKITIIDCRNETEKITVPINETINPTLIKDSISNLLPLSKIDVKVKILNLTDIPELEDLLSKYSGRLDSWIHRYLFLSPMNESYIDAQPIYEYLKENLEKIMPEDNGGEGYIIPVIAFALSQDYHFMFKYKWLILRRNPESSTIWGAAFKEFALVGLSQKDFFYGEYVEPKQESKGFGFTQPIIHEVGHMLGLAHPHTYGDLGDFVCSAMSYFSYEYGFSIFDKDALARAHIDKHLIETRKIISEIERKLPLKIDGNKMREIKDRVDEVKRLLNDVDSAYSRMNYLEAWRMALDAYKLAREISVDVENLPSIPENITVSLEEKEAEIVRLNQSYTELSSRHNELLFKYDELMNNYMSLSSKCEAYLSELNLFRSLSIALFIVVCFLAATTIYFARRKHLSIGSN
ncbi:MAG: hypothetical protein QXR84_09355 [Candidatus Bathyarchaeia archaeon]